MAARVGTAQFGHRQIHKKYNSANAQILKHKQKLFIQTHKYKCKYSYIQLHQNRSTKYSSEMNHSSHDGSMNLSLRSSWNVDIRLFCLSASCDVKLWAERKVCTLQCNSVQCNFKLSATQCIAMPNYELAGMFALGQSCRRFWSAG